MKTTNGRIRPLFGGNGSISDDIQTQSPIGDVRWLFAALLLFFTLQWMFAEYIVDDTFIHLTFARNLAGGEGFSFNPGQPTYGVSAPLWTLFLALASLIFGTGPALAKGLSLIFGALSIPALRSLASRVGLSHRAANWTMVVWAGNTWLARWSASGMEASLATLLLILAFDSHLRGHAWTTGILSGLCMLTRPETAGLALLFAADRWWTNGARKASRTLLAALLVLLPWLLFAIREFGTIVPNPARIKSDLLLPPLEDFFLGVKRTISIIGGGHGIEVMLVLLALILIARNRAFTSDLARVGGLMVIWAIFPAIVYLAKGVFVQSRYLLIGLPPLIMGGFAALDWIAGQRRPQVRRLAMPLLAAVLVGQHLILTQFVTLPQVHSFRGTTEALVRLAERVRLESSPEAMVAVGDVGIVGFYSDRKVLDLEGLVSAGVIPYRLGMRLDDFILSGRFFAAGRPDLIIDKARDPRRLEGRWGAQVIVVEPITGGLFETSDQAWYYTLYRLPA